MNKSKETQTFSSRKTLREGLPQFVGFEVLFRLLGAILFTPLVAWLTTRLIKLSGNGAISNYDIANFLLSVNGQLYLATVISLAFALLFFEFGGLIALALAIHRGANINLPRLLRFLVVSLPKLWRLSIRQFFVYLLIAIPCLAITGLAYLKFLTESDINYYLIAKPPAYWITVAIAGGSALAFIVVAGRRFIDWIFSIPLVLLTDASPAQALKASTAIARPHRKELMMMLLRWALITMLLFLALSIIIFALEWTLLGLAGKRVSLVISMTAILAVVQVISAGVVGLLVYSLLACKISKCFMEWGPEVTLPVALTEGESNLINKVTALLRIGWIVAVIFAALSGYAAMKILETNRLPENVGITAHRGSSITAPENTMAAILLAAEEGAEYVEIDVQETSDGTVVLVHDKDLLRVFGIRKGIWEVSFDELKDLDSGGWFSPDYSDQRLATLDQVIKAVKGKTKLNIELKFNGHQKQLAKEVVRIVRENAFTEDCILTSLDYAGLQRARAAGPELRTGIIVTSAIGNVTKLGGELISVSAGSVTRDLIDRAKLANLEVHVWTVNNVQQMNKMIGMGVNQIITDDPKLLGEVIAHRATLSPAELNLLRLADIAENRFAIK